MEILIDESAQEGYKVIRKIGDCRVALINYTEAIDRLKWRKIERHTQTDESFILLQGNATLVVTKDLKKYPMEQGKIYTIPENVWHAIYCSSDAKILVVEKDEVEKNTERIWFEKNPQE